MSEQRGTVTFVTRSFSHRPKLEILHDSNTEIISFQQISPDQGHCRWQAHPQLNRGRAWQFRIKLSDDTYAAPSGQGSFDTYSTRLSQLWVQNGEIYSYEPTYAHTNARVVKIPHFTGSLPKRALYIYLPRGYDQHTFKRYPVIYMQDGQNCFESYKRDSYVGSWRADLTADHLIAKGKMQECIIVGVSHGGSQRIAEYMPPYSSHTPSAKNDSKLPFKTIYGSADKTAHYYINEVAPYVNRYYRTLTGRQHTATCGSSMGGLFSMYMAWEFPHFARHHATLSSSFWITEHGENGHKRMEMVERMRHQPQRDMRLWLDSGTGGENDYGDDNMQVTIEARDALLANGYKQDTNFRYHLAEGRGHRESAWADRLPLIFEFLFPLT